MAAEARAEYLHSQELAEQRRIARKEEWEREQNQAQQKPPRT